MLLKVHCWGRTYEFGKAPFLFQIVTAGKPILSRPIRLIASVGSGRIRWSAPTIEVKERSASRVALSQRSSTEHLNFNADIEIQYDGMVRVDWGVEAVRRLQLKELRLEIPLDAQYASYVYQFPSSDVFFMRRPYRLGSLPADGLSGGFNPVIWLGDEERGIEWFSESDKNWYSNKPESAIEIARAGGEVILRLNLVTQTLHMAPGGQRSGGVKMPRPEAGALGDIAYTFGFQATPVKPVTRDVWDYRIVHVSPGGLGTSEEVGTGARFKVNESSLDRMAELGVRTIAFHEHWTDIHGHTATSYEEELKWLVEACHHRGMQLLLYFGYLMSDLAPEWQTHFGECLTHPVGKGAWIPCDYPPQPVQNVYVVCYRSPWQDFLADGIARAMDNYDVDGVYLDGTSNPFWGCRNLFHGCGYVRPDGEVVGSYALFPIRQTLKRIYTIVKTRKPDGQVNVHQSGAMNISALSWATSYWDGEVLGGARKASTLEILPLDAFRTEYMGHQWGVPAEFLDYTLGACTGCTWTQAHAFTLLHDVPVRPCGSLQRVEEASLLWKAMEAFDRKVAEWLPYWKNEDYVTVRPEEAYVSLYRHSKNGVLAMVSNLSRTELTIDVCINLSRLGLGKDAKAHDALTGDSIPVDSGKIMIALPSLGWALIWLRD